MKLFETFKEIRENHPDHPAFLITAGDRYVPIRWKQFTDDIAATAWVIQKYAPGIPVGILGENSYEWIVTHAACLMSGAIAVPIDPNLQATEIARRLKFVGARSLIYSSLYSEKASEVERIAPGVACGGFGTLKTDGFLNEARERIAKNGKTCFDGPAPDPCKVSMMVFTSGTTSEPRGVQLTTEALQTAIESWDELQPMKFGDRSLMMLPLNHIFGIVAAYKMLCSGVVLGVCPDFRRLYDAVERFRINFAYLVPALAEILVSKIEKRGKSAEEALGTRIEWIATGGAPISRRVHERLQAVGIKSIGMYGLTETCACYSAASTSEEFAAGSAGLCVRHPKVDTRVADNGELLVRGPNVMKGYYKMPERTAAAIDKDGWFHTGDRGRIDEKGFVWITGRMSRTIILDSGKKVAPEELEEHLLSLPGILEALVSGDKETRKISAEVYASIPEETVKSEISQLNLRLPVYERIHNVIVRSEPFPRTTSGKIKLSKPVGAQQVEVGGVNRGLFAGFLKVASCTLLALGILILWLSDMIPEIIVLCGVKLSTDDAMVVSICELVGKGLLAIGGMLFVWLAGKVVRQFVRRFGI